MAKQFLCIQGNNQTKVNQHLLGICQHNWIQTTQWVPPENQWLPEISTVSIEFLKIVRTSLIKIITMQTMSSSIVAKPLRFYFINNVSYIV